MIEKPSASNETTETPNHIHGRPDAKPGLLSQRIGRIQKLELRDSIGDFIDENQKEFRGFPKDWLLLKIEKLVSSIRLKQPDFKVIDLDPRQVLETIGEFQNEEIKDTRRNELKPRLKNLDSLGTYIQKQKAQGVPNNQLIKLVLAEHDNPNGAFTLPKEKYEQYSNFLSLLTNQEFAQDRGAITEIVNSEPDLLAGGAFESVAYWILHSDKVSERTKITLSKRFKIKRIGHGADLKNALLKQKEANNSYKKRSHELNKEISNLETEIETIRKELASKDGDKKQLEGKLQTLIDQKADLDNAVSKRKRTKPINEIPLRGAIARLEDGAIEVRIPGLKQSLQVPIDSGNETLGRAVNSLFLYRALNRWGLTQLIFPGEVFGNADEPSNHMRTFSNEMLSAMSISNSGTILTRTEYQLMERLLGSLRSEDSEIDDLDSAKKDLESKGLLKDGVLIRAKWLEHLNALQIVRNS